MTNPARPSSNSWKVTEHDWVSDKLVALVGIVFGVVIVQSLVTFNNILFPPIWSVELIGLIGVYFATITSWYGYHRSMSKYPYTPTRLGFCRVVIDVIIVILYVHLLYSIEVITKSVTIYNYLWGFAIVNFMYVVDGYARRWEHEDPSASRVMLNLVFLIIFFLLAIAYFLLATLAFSNHLASLNWIFIFGPLAVTFAYRLIRIRSLPGTVKGLQN